MPENTNNFYSKFQQSRAQLRVSDRLFLVCILQSTNCKYTQPFNIYMHYQKTTEHNVNFPYPD